MDEIIKAGAEVAGVGSGGAILYAIVSLLIRRRNNNNGGKAVTEKFCEERHDHLDQRYTDLKEYIKEHFDSLEKAMRG